MNKVEMLPNGNIKITIPVTFRNCAGRKRIITPDSDVSPTDPLITSLARAFRWQSLIDEGKFYNVHDLARTVCKDDAYVSRITRLTLLAPDIVHGILTGTLGKPLGIEMCKKPFPVLWSEQRKFFGLDEEAR